VGRIWQQVAGTVVAVGAVLIASPRALAQGAPSIVQGGSVEYLLNVPPVRRMNPWQSMMLLARQRLQEIRCLIPQASLQGTLRDPKGEICYRKNGMRACLSSKLSFSPNNYSGGFFITNRPGDCPF
jgi:hypothetical protein